MDRQNDFSNAFEEHQTGLTGHACGGDTDLQALGSYVKQTLGAWATWKWNFGTLGNRGNVGRLLNFGSLGTCKSLGTFKDLGNLVNFGDLVGSLSECWEGCGHDGGRPFIANP